MDGLTVRWGWSALLTKPLSLSLCLQTGAHLYVRSDWRRAGHSVRRTGQHSHPRDADSHHWWVTRLGLSSPSFTPVLSLLQILTEYWSSVSWTWWCSPLSSCCGPTIRCRKRLQLIRKINKSSWFKNLSSDCDIMWYIEYWRIGKNTQPLLSPCSKVLRSQNSEWWYLYLVKEGRYQEMYNEDIYYIMLFVASSVLDKYCWGER